MYNVVALLCLVSMNEHIHIGVQVSKLCSYLTLVFKYCKNGETIVVM